MKYLVDLGLVHSKIKLIRVFQGGLFLQRLQSILFAMVVHGPLFVVFVLFEQAKLGAVRGLRSLLVYPPMHNLA